MRVKPLSEEITQLAKRIELFRRDSEIKQPQFAKKLGVTATAYAHVASTGTKPSAELLMRLAKHTRVNLRWLLTGEGEMRGAEAPAQAPALAAQPLDSASNRDQISGGVGDLGASEKELLTRWRRLGWADQRAVMGVFDGLETRQGAAAAPPSLSPSDPAKESGR